MGHVVTTTGICGGGRQTIRYVSERVVGNGSFGVVFQARCLETGETVSCRSTMSEAGARWRAGSTCPRAGSCNVQPPSRQLPPSVGACCAPSPPAPIRPTSPRPLSQVAIKKVLQDKRFKVRRRVPAAERTPPGTMQPSSQQQRARGWERHLARALTRRRCAWRSPPVRAQNRELQIIRMMNHPNIVQLKHCFYTTTDKVPP